VVELVALVWHLHAVDDLRVAVGLGVDVNNRHEVGGVDVGSNVQSHHVSRLLVFGLLDRRLRRRIARPTATVVVIVVVILMHPGIGWLLIVAHARRNTRVSLINHRLPVAPAYTCDDTHERSSRIPA
jgi:hypothetical protein